MSVIQVLYDSGVDGKLAWSGLEPITVEAGWPVAAKGRMACWLEAMAWFVDQSGSLYSLDSRVLQVLTFILERERAYRTVELLRDHGVSGDLFWLHDAGFFARIWIGTGEAMSNATESWAELESWLANRLERREQT